MVDRIRHLTVVLLALLAAGGAVAQGMVQCDFTVFADQALAGVFFVPGERQPPEELKFTSQSRSAVYHYVGSSQIIFYTREEGAQAGTPTARGALPAGKPVAVAQLPAGVSKFLLVFSTIPEPQPHGPRYNVFVLDDSGRTLPGGHVGVINLSGLSAAAQIGAAQLQAPAGASQTVQAIGDSEVQLAVYVGDRWARVGTRSIRLTPRDRTWVVLFPPTSAGSVQPQIRMLFESAPAPRGAR